MSAFELPVSLCYCLLTVNGGWSAWTSWSSCSSSVARGLSKRQRTCTNSSPSALGRDCNGDSTEQRNCPGKERLFETNRMGTHIQHSRLGHKKPVCLATDAGKKTQIFRFDIFRVYS